MADITRSGSARLVANEGGVDPIVAPYTVAAADNSLLVVGVCAEDARSISGVTWNGDAMTLTAGPVTGNGDRKIWMYHLLNPDTGTHNFSFDFDAGPSYFNAYAEDCENALQSNQPDHTATNTSSGATSLAAALVTVADRCWGVAFVNEDAGTTVTWTNATERHTNAGEHFADTNAVITPAGSETITGQTGSANMRSIIAASFKGEDFPVSTPAAIHIRPSGGSF